MKVKSNYVAKSVLDNTIVIDVSGFDKNIIKLNETGFFMFNLLKDGISYEELVNKMFENYDETKEVLEKDVKEFVDKLKELNILDD